LLGAGFSGGFFNPLGERLFKEKTPTVGGVG
jgi:hypothetical protein